MVLMVFMVLMVLMALIVLRLLKVSMGIMVKLIFGLKIMIIIP